MMSGSDSLHGLGVAEAARKIRQREVSPVDLVEALLARIERSQPTLKAFVTVDAEGARAAARAAEASLSNGDPLGPLHGVPFAAKDIYDAAGLPTSAGYRPLADVPARADCFSVAKLKAAGAILVGKAVTTQFASSDPSPSVNPWRADRTPAGSSSGSGVGVAARLVPMALGTQTGGSILRPAAYNGVVGLKPTYGRVSRQGIVPLSWSLDHAGPIVRSVEDAALTLGVIAGHDPRDPQSLAADIPDYTAALAKPLTAPRLGLLVDFLERAEPEVRAHLEGIADQLRAAGATVQEVKLPSPFDLYHAVHAVTMQSEGAAVHATWLARDRSHYSPRIKASAMLGQVLPSWAYLHAQRLRRRLAEETTPLLADLDAFLLPTASNLPPGPETTGDASFQAPWSLLGWPSISLPSGMSDQGLPFATQFVGRHLDEPTLLRTAAWAERVFDFQARPPEKW
jgi:aspartyl-tRNA(Asn)/glutamyl-tRNA(Gln) amidotransferase subunit A